jgi:hypothetical protein
MSSVTHLTQHLLKLDPGKSVARQTLFNYLKVYLDGSAPLTAEVLNHFFAYVLNYQFWQQNAKVLGETIFGDLDKFAHTHRLDFEFQHVRFPHLCQLVILEFQTDAEMLIQRREATLSEEGDRLKLMPISESQLLVINLKRMGALEVRVYGRTAQIHNGEIQLIRPISDLKYNARLELAEGHPQLLEGPMVTAARFQVTHEGYQGVMVRGHMLQRFETLVAGGLNLHAELFYGLKRIERYFINSATDPYYRELLTQLERAQQAVNVGHPDARRLATSALQKGKAALKHIFPNDKALLVLVTNIEFALMGPKSEDVKWTNEKPLTI